MIKYGLISETDARTLEKTIDLIMNNADNLQDIDLRIMPQNVHITEIGIYGGDTGKGIKDYVKSKKGQCFITGVDNNKDGEILRNKYDRLIIGNSNEVYNKIPYNSQHLIFIDGDHSFIGVISDFFAYAPKVKIGGYMAFHDTGKHIRPFKDFQHGDKENPEAYISVRKALLSIGMLPTSKSFEGLKVHYVSGGIGWELVFDEADETNPAGGICVFKKLF